MSECSVIKTPLAIAGIEAGGRGCELRNSGASGSWTRQRTLFSPSASQRSPAQP